MTLPHKERVIRYNNKRKTMVCIGIKHGFPERFSSRIQTKHNFCSVY